MLEPAVPAGYPDNHPVWRKWMAPPVIRAHSEVSSSPTVTYGQSCHCQPMCQHERVTCMCPYAGRMMGFYSGIVSVKFYIIIIRRRWSKHHVSVPIVYSQMVVHLTSSALHRRFNSNGSWIFQDIPFHWSKVHAYGGAAKCMPRIRRARQWIQDRSTGGYTEPGMIGWLVISALSSPTSQITPATATREEPHGRRQRDGDQHSRLTTV
jgi:hypothetical protein